MYIDLCLNFRINKKHVIYNDTNINYYKKCQQKIIFINNTISNKYLKE